MAEVEKASELLRRVSNFLRSLTDDQIDDLLTGKTRIILAPTSRAGRAGKRADRKDLDVVRIREELTQKKTREEGIDLLESLALNRSALQEIAVAMDLPNLRSDTVERLKDRIVDAAIGYRLRSDAIRSTD